jgi:aspartate/methionine/tyrosine aminotransferase
MNPLAQELNQVIEGQSAHLMEMLSAVGRNLFFPKGILTQSAEAKEKAHQINATAGIAREKGRTMVLEAVTELVKTIQPSEAFTYAPSYGIPELRQFWQKALFKKNPSLAGKTISLPIVTNGITHGVSTVADVWTDPGDVVIVPDMMWGNYNMIFNVRKGVHLRSFAFFNDQGGFNIEAFEQRIRTEAAVHAKLVVMLNFPHNPSGYTASLAEGQAIVGVLTAAAESGTNIIAVADDSYFGLFYDPNSLQESLFAMLAQRHPRLLSIKLDGATKENFVWGLRVGFLTYAATIEGDSRPVYEALEKKTAGDIRGTISNASHLGQTIVLKSMRNEKFAQQQHAKFEILESRARRVRKVLENPKYAEVWDVYPFNSGYFMCLRLKTVYAEQLRQHLLENYGIGLIALGEYNLRVAFSCTEEDEIEELFDTIYTGIQDLSSDQ